jgi:hypothetical protein
MKGEGDVVSGLKEWADFLGAGLLRCTGEMDRQPLSPASLAMAAVPWAILTSAFQGFILVPLFPFGSPSSRCSSPTGSASSSGSMLAWLRRSASERKAFEGRSFLGLEH